MYVSNQAIGGLEACLSSTNRCFSIKSTYVEFCQFFSFYNSQIIINLLSDIKGFKLNEPDGAFYIFPDISYFFGKTIDGFEIKDSTDFSLFLLEKAMIHTFKSLINEAVCSLFLVTFFHGCVVIKESILLSFNES